MAKAKKILMVEDEPKIVEVVSAYLHREGFRTIAVSTGHEALESLDRDRPDMVILDLRLPDIPGEEICKSIRKNSRIPILMLTAKAEEDDKIAGFSLGADDYLTKPFGPRELVARVQALLRRAGEAQPLQQNVVFGRGEYVIDISKRTLLRNSIPIVLTGREFDLLVILAGNPGIVYSRAQLLDMVFGMDFDGLDRTIDVHVKNLRKKIEQNPETPLFIKTIYGSGYKFEDTG